MLLALGILLVIALVTYPIGEDWSDIVSCLSAIFAGLLLLFSNVLILGASSDTAKAESLRDQAVVGCMSPEKSVCDDITRAVLTRDAVELETDADQMKQAAYWPFYN